MLKFRTNKENIVSDNLYARTNHGQVDLWQTPSYVTHMCLMSSRGYRSSVRGNKAVRALRCYLEYVGWSLHGSRRTQEELDEVMERVARHKEDIESLFNADGLEVYTL
jgi:hypothetical protein